MKRSLMLIFICWGILGLVGAPAAGAVSLHRIAVLPFDDGSIKDRSGGNKIKLGKGVADELVAALLETGRFRLIERERVDQVLAEQDLGKEGLLDPQTAARIGKILGVQYLVVGKVTEFTSRKDDDLFGNPDRHRPMGMLLTKTTSRVALDARLVDAATAEIITSVTGTGQKKTVNLGLITKQGGISFGDKGFKESDLGKALREAVTSVARQLALRAYEGTAPLPITGMISYVSAERLIINVGKRDGVEPGMVFKVFRILQPLTDPATGETIGAATEPIAEILVTKVKEKTATCTIVARLSAEYQIAVADPIESKTPVKTALPDLPPLERDTGPGRGPEFRVYCESMIWGKFTEETPGEDSEADETLTFLGGRLNWGRVKLAGERTGAGEIETNPPGALQISELKFGYNLNPDQDVQIELFLSDFELEIKGGSQPIDCSSIVFGADIEHLIAAKTHFELSYGYGASLDLKIGDIKKSEADLALLKLKFSHYFSESAAVYAGYRSYMIKQDNDQDFSGITAGLVFQF